MLECRLKDFYLLFSDTLFSTHKTHSEHPRRERKGGENADVVLAGLLLTHFNARLHYC